MTRIYSVALHPAVGTGTRLVRATSKAQALRHVAENVFKVEVATQDELVGLIANGIQVEDATPKEPPVLAELPPAVPAVPQETGDQPLTEADATH